MVKRIVCAALMVAGGWGAAGAEWFVDRNRPDDSGAGTSEATAKRTIQAAVNAATAGDTVTVLPGVYDEGTTEETSSLNRVVIRKRLTLRARDGAAVTHIVGRHDPDTSNGMGDNAVRCVWVTGDGAGTVIRDFTIRDGASCYAENGKDIAQNRGGGLMTTSGNVIVVGCVFRNCVATRGGATYYGTAYRCLYDGNRNTANGAAARHTTLVNCVLTRNKGTNGVLAYGAALNCTFVGNAVNAATNCGNKDWDKGFLRNCLFAENETEPGTSVVCVNCVAGGRAATAGGIVQNAGAVVMAGLFDDWRVVSGSAADGTGDAADYAAAGAALPGFAEFGGEDFFGAPRLDNGVLSVGAVQAAAVPRARASFHAGAASQGTLTVDGRAVYGNQTVCAETWPTQYVVKATAADAAKHLVYYALSNTATAALTYLPPSMDDTFVFVPDCDAVDAFLYGVGPECVVDPVSGNDTTGDGTAARPYETLQKAVDTATGPVFIRAREGVYGKGRKQSGGGHWNRLVANRETGFLRIFGEAGAAKTVLTGDSDAVTAASPYGTGSGAARCAALKRALLQGFTLTGGRSAGDKSSGDGEAVRGGGVWAVDATGMIADCVVSNNVASRGGALFLVTTWRCLVTENRAMANGVTRSAKIYNSLIVGNHATPYTIGQDTKLYGSTVAGNMQPESGGFAVAHEGNTSLYGCVVAGNSKNDLDASRTTKCYDTLYQNAGQLTCLVSGFKADPMFVNAAAGDWRVRPLSPAAYRMEPTICWPGMMSDYTGAARPVKDGKITLGAYGTPREGVRRYVDVAGDDGNDGLTWGDAKRTIQAAVDDCMDDDIVTVGPGVYDAGEALQPAHGNVTPTLGSRVSITRNITLESRDGAAATIIKGRASAADTHGLGLGAGALRCVVVTGPATVRGFTLTGGRTLAENVETDDNHGGGFLSVGGQAWLVDCVVSNNASIRGGGARYANCLRCAFFENAAKSNGSATRDGTFYQCLFARNRLASTVAFPSVMVNCTIAGDNRAAGDAPCKAIWRENNTQGILRNTLIAAPNGIIWTADLDTCAYEDASQLEKVGGDVVNCVCGPLALDAAYRPAGAACAAVDAGDNTVAEMAGAPAGAFDTDLAGNPRVANRRVDIGCFEHDWRAEYARALGGATGFAVEAAPGDALLTAETDGVLLAGGELTAAWANAAGGARHSFSYRLTGGGTLTVTVNGAEVARVTGPCAWTEGVYVSDAAVDALSIVYEPAAGDGDGVGALLKGFCKHNGTVLFFR